MEPENTPGAPASSVTTRIVASALIAAVVGSGITYATLTKQNNNKLAERDAKIATLEAQPTPTPTPTPTATPVPTATPSAKYTKLTDKTYGFSFEYPTEWVFSRYAGGDGVPASSYTALTKNADMAGVYNEGNMRTGVSTINEVAVHDTLDKYMKDREGHYQQLDITDTTIGTGKYAAKRYTDGGGIYGITVSYVVHKQLSDGTNLFVTLSKTVDDDKAAMPADFQHMLDTFTF